MSTPLGSPSQGFTLLVKNANESAAIKEGTLVGFDVGGIGLTVPGLNTTGEPEASFVDAQTQPSDFGAGNRRFGNKDMIAVPCIVDPISMCDYEVSGRSSQSDWLGAANILGVALQDLEVGEIGDALMVGVVQVYSKSGDNYSDITKGQAICSTGDGCITNANYATNKTNNAFGFSLESVTKGEKCWCYINTIAPGNADGAISLFPGVALSKYRGKIF